MRQKYFWRIVYVVFILVLLELTSYSIIKLKYPFLKFGLLPNRELSGYYIFRNTSNYKYPYVYSDDLMKSNLRTDQFGFLKNFESYLEYDSNTIRVFLCGGSAAISAGQTHKIGYENIYEYSGDIFAFDISLAGLLQKKLNQQIPSKNFKVINTASFNRTMHQSLLLYLETISILKPNIVISMDGYNDLPYLIEGDPFPSYEHEFLKKYSILGFIKNRKYDLNMVSLCKLLFLSKEPNESRIKDYTDSFKIKNREIEDEKRIDLIKTTNLRWLQILNHFQSAVQLDDASFIFVLQPVLASKINKELSEREKSFLSIETKEHVEDYGIGNDLKLDMDRLDSDTAYSNSEIQILKNDYWLTKRYLYADIIASEIEQQVEVNNGWFINANKEIKSLTDSVEFYTDYCHMTIEGNSILADIIAKKIIDQNIVSMD